MSGEGDGGEKRREDEILVLGRWDGMKNDEKMKRVQDVKRQGLDAY